MLALNPPNHESVYEPYDSSGFQPKAVAYKSSKYENKYIKNK
jgi:hypothetical protein